MILVIFPKWVNPLALEILLLFKLMRFQVPCLSKSTKRLQKQPSPVRSKSMAFQVAVGTSVSLEILLVKPKVARELQASRHLTAMASPTSPSGVGAAVGRSSGHSATLVDS